MAVFAGLVGLVREVTLFDAGAGRSEARTVEAPYAGSLFQCYSHPGAAPRGAARGGIDQRSPPPPGRPSHLIWNGSPVSSFHCSFCLSVSTEQARSVVSLCSDWSFLIAPARSSP